MAYNELTPLIEAGDDERAERAHAIKRIEDAEEVLENSIYDLRSYPEIPSWVTGRLAAVLRHLEEAKEAIGWRPE